MNSFHTLPAGPVRFELQGGLPILRERYHSPQAGRVVLKGFANQSAHMELPDGTRYRTLAPRRDSEYPDQLAYPVVRLPGRQPVLKLRTPLRIETGAAPQLRFVTTVDNRRYVFKLQSAGKRGFELWDSSEMVKVVSRDPGQALVSRLTLLEPTPTLLVLLFPWLDNQLIPQAKP